VGPTNPWWPTQAPLGWGKKRSTTNLPVIHPEIAILKREGKNRPASGRLSPRRVRLNGQLPIRGLTYPIESTTSPQKPGIPSHLNE
jgi:hypothetical protein